MPAATWDWRDHEHESREQKKHFCRLPSLSETSRRLLWLSLVFLGQVFRKTSTFFENSSWIAQDRKMLGLGFFGNGESSGKIGPKFSILPSETATAFLSSSAILRLSVISSPSKISEQNSYACWERLWASYSLRAIPPSSPPMFESDHMCSLMALQGLLCNILYSTQSYHLIILPEGLRHTNSEPQSSTPCDMRFSPSDTGKMAILKRFLSEWPFSLYLLGKIAYRKG